MKYFFDWQFSLTMWALPFAFAVETVNKVQNNLALEIVVAILCFQFEFTFTWDPRKFKGFWKFVRLIFAVLCIIIGVIMLMVNLNEGTWLINVMMWKLFGFGVFASGLYLFKSYK